MVFTGSDAKNSSSSNFISLLFVMAVTLLYQTTQTNKKSQA